MQSAEATPSYLPWDTSAGNRFAYYSTGNHSAPLWIAALLGLIYVVGVLLIRTSIKRHVLGWDDYLIVASTVTAFGQFIVIYSALKIGLGKIGEDVSDARLLGRFVFSSRTLYLVSSYLAKLSVLFLLYRLFVRDQKVHKLLGKLVAGFTIVSGLVSCVISTVGCPSSGYFTAHCQNQILRWRVVTSLDVLTEIIALLIPLYMVWRLQMKVGNKVRVVIAFYFRLSVIVLTILHLIAWEKYTTGSPTPFDIVQSLLWQQLLLAVSLITATIPNLNAFIQSLSVNWGKPNFGYTSTGTKACGNETFELETMKSSKLAASRIKSEVLLSSQDETSFKTQIYTPRREGGERSSHESGGSLEFIIRKETVWTVERT